MYSVCVCVCLSVCPRLLSAIGGRVGGLGRSTFPIQRSGCDVLVTYKTVFQSNFFSSIDDLF